MKNQTNEHESDNQLRCDWCGRVVPEQEESVSMRQGVFDFAEGTKSEADTRVVCKDCLEKQKKHFA